MAGKAKKLLLSEKLLIKLICNQSGSWSCCLWKRYMPHYMVSPIQVHNFSFLPESTRCFCSSAAGKFSRPLYWNGFVTCCRLSLLIYRPVLSPILCYRNTIPSCRFILLYLILLPANRGAEITAAGFQRMFALW